MKTKRVMKSDKGAGKLNASRALAYNKIEGLSLSPRMQRVLEQADAQGLSGEQKRARIAAQFRKKTA